MGSHSQTAETCIAARKRPEWLGGMTAERWQPDVPVTDGTN